MAGVLLICRGDPAPSAVLVPYLIFGAGGGSRDRVGRLVVRFTLSGLLIAAIVVGKPCLQNGERLLRPDPSFLPLQPGHAGRLDLARDYLGLARGRTASVLSQIAS